MGYLGLFFLSFLKVWGVGVQIDDFRGVAWKAQAEAIRSGEAYRTVCGSTIDNPSMAESTE